MKKTFTTILTAALAALSCFTAKADEGMWLPSLISQRIADMQEKGFFISVLSFVISL